MLAFPLPAHKAGFGRSTGNISGRAKVRIDHSARLAGPLRRALSIGVGTLKMELDLFARLVLDDEIGRTRRNGCLALIAGALRIDREKDIVLFEGLLVTALECFIALVRDETDSK